MERKYLGRVCWAVAIAAMSGCASTPPQENTHGGAPQAPTEQPVAVAVKKSVAAPTPPKSAESATAPASTERPAAVTAPPVVEAVKPVPVKTPAEDHHTPAGAGAATAPVKVRLPTDPNTFIITAGNKDRSHPYYGVGSEYGFSLNGVQGKSIALVRGEKYTFDVDTGVKHDFYFSTSDIGRGVGVMAEGVQGQFTYKGLVTFAPTAATPSELFYECRNHRNMGGRIKVVNKGESVTLERTAVDASRAVVGIPTVKASEQQVRQ
ncbi:MAG: hypothetical protein FD130_603, partial [Halothiobacillaceae bacterium]